MEALDCDGDGVTNGQEVTDGIDPADPSWFCTGELGYGPDRRGRPSTGDGDGATNGDEVAGDGTDPLDECDLYLYEPDRTAERGMGGRRLRRRRCDQRWRDHWRYRPCGPLRLPAHQPDGADHPGVEDLDWWRRRGDQRRRGCDGTDPLTSATLTWPARPYAERGMGGPWLRWRWRDQRTGGNRTVRTRRSLWFCTGEPGYGPDRCVGGPRLWRRWRPTATRLPMAPTRWTNATLFIRSQTVPPSAAWGRLPTATARWGDQWTRSIDGTDPVDPVGL